MNLFLLISKKCSMSFCLRGWWTDKSQRRDILLQILFHHLQLSQLCFSPSAPRNSEKKVMLKPNPHLSLVFKKWRMHVMSCHDVGYPCYKHFWWWWRQAIRVSSSCCNHSFQFGIKWQESWPSASERDPNSQRKFITIKIIIFYLSLEPYSWAHDAKLP